MTRLRPVSEGCYQRLIGHYGNAARAWLATVPTLLTQAARRWRLDIAGYHDAGHASVLAVAATSTGVPVMLKAWFDPSRYIRETGALSQWRGGPVPRLLHAADDLYIAALTLIADMPGGRPAPAADEEKVAAGLRQLHSFSVAAAVGGTPSLDDYLAEQMLPRIRRRSDQFGGNLPADCLIAGRRAAARLNLGARRPLLLHGDLYQENIPFDQNGRPVFLDPLPMIGDPAFDWAFWTVYYDLMRDPVHRLQLAGTYAEIPVEELLPWCLTLSLDGLLYYYEYADSRLGRMVEVIKTLAAVPVSTSPC